MNDKEEKQIQELKDLEQEARELRSDARSIETNLPGRVERVKELESALLRANTILGDLYANLRVLNNQIDEKNDKIKEILNVWTGAYYSKFL